MRDIEDWMWAEALEMLGRAERMQRQFFQPNRRARRAVWVPPLDVYESDDEILVAIALPGVTPDSVRVQHEGRLLLVEGVRHIPVAQRNTAIHRMEIPHGWFERTLQLPKGLHLEHQEFTGGCLYLSFRKV